MGNVPCRFAGFLLMSVASSKSAAVALLVLLLTAGQARATETLRVGGTGTAIGMLQQVGAEFSAAGAETAAGSRRVAVLRTAYVLATSHQSPNELKAADLPKIFLEQIPVWGDGTPIRIILRPRGEADTAPLGDNLHVLTLDGAKPTLAALENGTYPFAKKLYFVTRANAAPAVHRFVEFLRSPPGIKALREAETVPGDE